MDFEFKSSYSHYKAADIADQLNNAKQSIEPFLRSDGAVIAFNSEPIYFTNYRDEGGSYIYNRDVLKEVGVSLEIGNLREYDCTPVFDEDRLHEYINIANTSSCYPSYHTHNFDTLTELIQRGEQGRVCGVALEGIEGTGNGSLILLPRPGKLTVRPEDWFKASLSVSRPYLPDNIREKLGKNEATDRNDSENTGDATIGDKLKNIFNRFYLVSQQLEYRHNSRETLRINDEHDVQDLLHSLLWLEFDDIRDEENAPSHAGSASRIDFLLKKKSIGLEVKIAYAGHTEKKLKNEISEDKEHYKQHPDCEKLFVFVYDPDRELSNPHGFENDLSSKNGTLGTEVIITPK
ncbi:PD-(D/E)XK nuclease domain-containing protein [Halorussus amylolyticus]|uniref:PD-(D/E)XK nuclease domain-containing protein n=1 Tax=Halorussus amylolyticus TaxID=1126242 RepID=UPI001EE42670|nr:hypothetical protein [Halorussus amylolyticus]